MKAASASSVEPDFESRLIARLRSGLLACVSEERPVGAATFAGTTGVLAILAATVAA